MLILHSLLSELKDEFASSENGKERSAWFLHTLLAIIIPFSSSRTSNLLRVLRTLFGYVEIGCSIEYGIRNCDGQHGIVSEGTPRMKEREVFGLDRAMLIHRSDNVAGDCSDHGLSP